MPWQDDPIVGQQPAQPSAGPGGAQWEQDPVVGPPAALAAPASPPQKPLGDISNALIDPFLVLGSGAAASAGAGLSFLGALGTNSLGLTDVNLRGLTERIQRALTYEPRTRSGEAGTKIATYPFEKLAQLGNYAGKKTTQGIVKAGGGEGLAATGGTAVGTAIQLLPALLLGARGRPTATEQQAATQAAEQQARSYVGTRTGLDYDALAQGTRAALNKIAAEPAALEGLDAAAVERQARFESLPVPIKTTAARITRDPVALRNEGNVAATNAGKPIRATFVDNNAKLIENIQALQGRRGPSRGETETGRAVQDALGAPSIARGEGLAQQQGKLAKKQAEVKALYHKAEAAGELQGNASTRPLAKLIRQSPDLQHLSWVETWMNKGKLVTDQAGRAAKGLRKSASLKELEDLRQAAVARTLNGGTDAHYAGKVIKAIDQATDGLGGNAYKAARKARTEQGLEFGDQIAVARLVSDKSRTDRAVALEDTWNDVVLRGSIEDLVKVKRSLLTGGDATTRTAGKSAWLDMRAETIAYIEREATKGVQLLEDGSPNVSPAALKKVVDKIGGEKLDQIFGSGTRRKIDQIVTAARDLKTEPTAVHGGSSTMGNVLAFLEQGLGRIPGGSMVSGTVRAIGKVNELGKAGRQVRESARDPLRDAAGRVESKNKLRQLAPAGTIQGQNQ